MAKPKYKPVIDQYFNKLVTKENGFTPLNTAFSKEGAYIRIHKNMVADKPIQIVNFATGNEAALMIQPRNLIVVRRKCPGTDH
jgi:Fe-S cluster assembly protein SufD